MKLTTWGKLTAFNAVAIGSRVLDGPAFMAALELAIEGHDPSSDRAPGQHFVICPPSMFALVSCGIGSASPDPDRYVLREWRGEVKAFLRREYAEPVHFVGCVVYTREAYLADPQLTEEEREALGDATHVLVAVLAGPSGPVPPGRFVANLAGGNNAELAMSGDEIRAEARKIADYWSRYSVVAD